MKNIVFLSLLFLLTTASFSSLYSQFENYAQSYSKKYDSKAEELYRFAVYFKNKLIIEALNANPEDDAVYGETKFTDLTVE
jgi:hypothetical protein